MRYSDQPRLDPTPVSGSAREFFAAIAAALPPEARRGGVLLVGGADPRALAERRAQAALRFDHRPSLWSHAALLVRWDGELDGRGVEAALDPGDLAAQVPERNGVTAFALERYLDDARHPNLAFMALVRPDAPRDAVVAAALAPNRERRMYPLHAWIGQWQRHVHDPFGEPSPLLRGVPHPGAALCEYAYAAARLDLIPGADGPNACPELIWATMTRWSEHLGGEPTAIRTWVRIGDPEARGLPALSADLRDAFADPA